MILQSTIFNSFLALPISHLLLGAIGIYTLFKFLLVFYRLSPLHPLARVPGPRFAAATWWFRTYYEVWPQYGEFTNEIYRLHEKYGPVVRIAPNEVHFSSASAFLHIYSHASKAVKDPFHYECFNADLSSVCFCNPVIARERRDIISPFFSRRNILAMQHIVEDKVCLFSHQLRSMYYDTNPIIDVCFAAKSFTNDLIMEFCFAKTLDTLRAPGFRHSQIEGTEKSLRNFWTFKQFPILKVIVLKLMPEKMVASLFPEAGEGILLLQRVLGSQVDRFIENPENLDIDRIGHEVIYHRLLGIKLQNQKNEDFVQPHKIERQSLYDESLALMFGGTDTVGNTLAVGIFHILNTPEVLDKLMVELRTVWPENPWEGMPEVGTEYIDGSGKLPVGWEVLEKLAYLSAVIKESLRMSCGAVTALQRLAPAQGITIDGWKFPKGTGVSSAIPFVHFNPSIFPDPDRFRPDRWIGPGAGALEKYLVAFSKGPRQCLGMNLAWCEVYLAFATLFRRFEFELVDTKPEDLRYKDFVTPMFVGRIQVRAKPRVD